MPPRPLTPLDHFRAKTKRLRIHPLEGACLWIVSLHLILLPWALGAMYWWTQALSLGLAVLGFALALYPREYTSDYTEGAAFRLLSYPKLLRFPIFWAGLALFLYIFVGGLNPAWSYVQGDKGWWMVAVDHIPWLPSGVRVPFFSGGGGPWRALIVYLSGWLVVCTVWIGFTRRRTVQLFLMVLAGNGVALAIFGIAQRLLHAPKIFWFFPSPNESFFSSFIYKNHAGAYLVLALVLSTGLAAWYYLRGLRRMEKSNPAGLFVFFAAAVAMSIVVSFARGATITAILFLAIAVAAFVVFQIRNPDLLKKPLVIGIMLIGFVFFARVGYQALSLGEAWTNMSRLIKSHETSVESRQLATQATWEMVQANPWGGYGAGSFRYVFPLYQQHYPQLLGDRGVRLYWTHAHNDLLEFPAEFGICGMAILVFGAGYWALRLLRNFFWENPLALLVSIGLLLLVAHGWTDFIFHNPAVLLTWCAIWPAITLWAEYEELNLRS